MRNLATIQKIRKIELMPNAENIVKARVLGWEVVIKKGEFVEGDLCVYCEIDSVLPEKPEFEFLRKNKFRIRTVRLRGQISQGIAFPLSILPKDIIIQEGKDVTEILGITKYEPDIPVEMSGIMKGKFPSFIPKTDATRVQVLQDVLTKYKGERCYITEKLDGTSVTYYIKDGEFGVCSRNIEFKECDNIYWKIAKIHKIEEKLRWININIALQGEIFGKGIQKNPLKLNDTQVRFFDIFDLDINRYFPYLDSKRYLIVKLNLEMVPLIKKDLNLIDDIQQIINIAEIKSIINPDVCAEGIVIQPIREIIDLKFQDKLQSGRLIFKVVNPEYLIEKEK